jgi:hypothetical protein
MDLVLIPSYMDANRNITFSTLKMRRWIHPASIGARIKQQTEKGEDFIPIVDRFGNKWLSILMAGPRNGINDLSRKFVALLFF